MCQLLRSRMRKRAASRWGMEESSTRVRKKEKEAPRKVAQSFRRVQSLDKKAFKERTKENSLSQPLRWQNEGACGEGPCGSDTYP